MIPLKGIFLMLTLLDGTIGLKPYPDMQSCQAALIERLNTRQFAGGKCLQGGMIMSPSIMDKQIDLLRGTLEQLVRP